MKRRALYCVVAAIFALSCAKETAVPVERIILKQNLEIIIGEEAGLKATVLPADASDKTVVWESSEPSVATVDRYGIVKAVAEGESIVTAQAGGVKAACFVNVVGIPVLDVKMSKRTLGILQGQSKKLEVEVYPENATRKTIQWSSSNKTVVSVTQDGTVTAVKTGVATVKASIGEIEASCQITVMNEPQECDFYYADGSWSPTLYTGKTPVGVVFWTGDPTASDPRLAKEHPECTHGLVVGLEEEYTSWQKNVGYVGASIAQDFPDALPPYASGGDSDFNRIIGYNNTNIMIEAEDYWLRADGTNGQIELVQRVAAYRKKVPLPEETSGWYCPSPKELSLICNGTYDGDIFSIGSVMGEKQRIAHYETIKNAIARIPDATNLSEFYYWSCTEDKDDVSRAFYMAFGWGDFSRCEKTDNGRRLRCIFAF